MRNNLEFTNQWSPNTGTITITSTFEHIDATHDFSYGYDLLVSNNCVFKSFTKEEYDLGSFNSYCLNPTLSSGSVKCSQMWKQTALKNYVRSTRYKYTLKPADTTPPTTNISVKRKSTGETVTGGWLKADTYTIQFTDDDNIGLKTCKYHVYKKDDSGNWTIPIANFDKPRTCSSFSFDIPAGTPPYEKKWTSDMD